MDDTEKSRARLLEELEALRRENRRLKAQIHQGEAAPKNGKTILIVDDNSATRELVADMVEELGYTAIAVSTSTEALAAFSRQPDGVDLVISDIVMPDGDGPHLLREIAKRFGPARIIFMSGYAGDEIVHDAVYQIQDSKAAFIKKPFTLTDIEPLITDQLAEPKADR